MQITKDKAVTIDYMLTDEKGQVIQQTHGREPFAFLFGRGMIVPGLEQALEGKSAGDEFEVTVTPDQGYGRRNPQNIFRVPKVELTDVDELTLGMTLHMRTKHGPRAVRLVGLERKTAIIDANHPLAGVTLKFNVTVREVRDATAEELDHGHVHGPGGHRH